MKRELPREREGEGDRGGQERAGESCIEIERKREIERDEVSCREREIEGGARELERESRTESARESWIEIERERKR